MSRRKPFGSCVTGLAAALAGLTLAACKGESHFGGLADAAAEAGAPDAALDGDAADAADAPADRTTDLGPACRIGGTSADIPTTLGCSSAPPGRLVVAGGYLYWTVQGAGPIVWRAPLVGGGPEPLVWDTAGAFGLVVDDTYVYYAQVSAGRVMRLPLAGGAPTTLAMGVGEPLFLAMASDGASLYWTDGEVDGKVVRLDLAAGAKPVILIDGQSGPRALAVRDGFVYWTDITDGTLLRTLDHLTGPPDAAVRTANRLASGLKRPTDLLLLGAFAYVPDENGFIQRVPLDGGDLAPVAKVDGLPYAVATDGASIYWSTLGTPGGIFKAPLDASGAAGMLFVGGQVDPHFLAVTADNVYWTTWGPRPAVHRLAK
jgi:hypothetical protein